MTGPFETAVRGGVKAFARTPRVLEKPSLSSQLGGRPDASPQKFEKTVPRLQVELVCQDGTKTHDPLWDAPRLTSPFVAQLLGQVMAGPRETPRAGTAYGAAAPRMALLVDRKS